MSCSVRTLAPGEKLGGRLKQFYQVWKTFCHDPHILKIIRGVRINFLDRPLPSDSCANPPPHSPEQAAAVGELLTKLLNLGVILAVPPHPQQVIHPIFATKNHDGSHRLILNSKVINSTKIDKRYFKMETLNEILRNIECGDFMTSLDLVKGYFNISLASEHRQYFCCQWEDVIYEFQALPMGITSAPRIFTQVMRALLPLCGIGESAFSPILMTPSYWVGLSKKLPAILCM